MFLQSLVNPILQLTKKTIVVTELSETGLGNCQERQARKTLAAFSVSLPHVICINVRGDMLTLNWMFLLHCLYDLLPVR